MLMLLGFLATTVLFPSPQPVSCGALMDAASATVRSLDGTSFTLSLHDEDDHGKNTHLCESEYKLAISPLHGSLSDADVGSGNDAAWGRPIVFRIEGFARSGGQVLAFVSEGGRDPEIQVIRYDVRSGRSDGFLISSSMIRHLGTACATTIKVAGLTEGGAVVMASSATGGCQKAESWVVTNRPDRHGSSVLTRLPSRSTVVALVPGSSESAAPR